jgi:DNA/RNA endonuclease YhcR with UshA esterase domain
MRADTEFLCASCGKPFGSGPRCDWCGVKRKHGLRRWGRRSWLIIALLFLVLLACSLLRSGKQTLSPADVGADMVGQSITVTGRVLQYWPPRPHSKAPHKIILTDGRGSIPIVFWTKDAAPLRQIPERGRALSAFGVVNLYKGNLEIKVNRPEDLTY